MKVGVDLLYVRPGIVGGTESFIRNLLDGFAALGEEEFVLFLARDNYDAFREYGKYRNLRLCRCPVDCAVPERRILWENLYLDGLVRQAGVDLMYIPVYSMPRARKGREAVPYVVTIQDLIPLHYPEYFSFRRRAFQKIAWTHTCREADRIVVLSDYCREDLNRHYPASAGKTVRVYDPVAPVRPVSAERTEEILGTYELKAGTFDYCVSSLLPHKNLDTILHSAQLRKERGIPGRLVISGVAGGAREFDEKIRARNLGDVVLRTGFVSGEVRDALYASCRLFLFPSVCEGFGLPPIEAMRRGKRVVMTRETCLAEVTQGRAIYVDDPYDAEEWLAKMDGALETQERVWDFPEYDLERVAGEYLEVFRGTLRGESAQN